MTEGEIRDSDLSFTDLIGKFKTWIRYLFSKWLLLLMIGLLGGVAGWIIASLKKPTYAGKLTFVLSTEAKGSNLSGIASQFGFDIGSGGGNDIFSGDNILSLFKSKKMIKTVLFKKPPSENDNLANIIVKQWEWDKSWKKSNRTENQFPFPPDPANLTPIQDSMVREIYLKLLDKGLSVSRLDKKLSVYELITTSENEIFSCFLTRFLMDETAKFYIDTKTSTAKLNLKMLQREADSLRGALGGAISSTAVEADRTFALNPAMQSQRAPAQKSQVRATVLATAYGEVVKNLELAKISLQRETPLYQIIDIPELPLKIKKQSKSLTALMGTFIGILITSIILFLFKK